MKLRSSATIDENRNHGRIELFYENNFRMAQMCFLKAGDKYYETLAEAYYLRTTTDKDAAKLFGSVNKKELAVECFFEVGDYITAGIAQRHDVVTGTAKQHTTNDYEKCLAIGALEAEVVVTSALSCLTSSTSNCTIPTLTLSQVAFLEPGDGRTSFKCLAHKIYKDLPYYLEWEPNDILSEDLTYKKDENNTSISGEQEVKRASLEEELEGTTNADIDT
ncbi:multiple RNA-binding domain-containing protein 1 isoform X1 [Tanacetum coccineum]